jgi:Na+/melibiose symporter-like transporter
MGVLGYVSEYGTIGQSAETAHNMCWLVAGLYMFSAVVQFIGLAIVYNLDKKTLATMREELDERHAVADGGAQAE